MPTTRDALPLPSAVRRVLATIDASGAATGTVLVRSPEGGGSDVVVRMAADALQRRGITVAAVTSLEAMSADEHLAARRLRREQLLLLAGNEAPLAPATSALVAYLRPTVVEVGPIDLDDARALLREAALTTSAPEIDGDELAAWLRRSTAGRLGDAIELAHHVAHQISAGGSASLVGFAPTHRRIVQPTAAVLPWAITTTEQTPAVAAAIAECAPPAGARPIDAAVISAEATSDERATALRLLCGAATAIPETELSRSELITIGAWWCELAAPGDPLGHDELMALLRGVRHAFEAHRWTAGRMMADRLWHTTRVGPAGLALATVLGRDAPTLVLEDIEAHHDAAARGAAAFTRALWQTYVEHAPDDAEQTLRRALADGAVAATTGQLLVDGLATIALHTGRPDQVEPILADRPGPTGSTTPFGLNALVLADLVRGRHGLALERLDAELDRIVTPGINLTSDRYRFFRAFGVSQRGTDPDGSATSQVEVTAELTRLYDEALDQGDDWHLGWTGWGLGLHEARAGQFLRAERRLRTSIAAFERAHRPGFAMWPTSALCSLHAIARVGDDGGSPTRSADAHAVRFDLADSLLARALLSRRDGASTAAVAAQLREAMSTAVRQHEVVTAHRIVLEQLLLGIEPDELPDDDRAAGADGVVVGVVRRLVASPRGDAWEAAGTALVDAGWCVLGVRLLGQAADRQRRDDPRASTRIRHTIQTVVGGFETPLQPWVLADDQLPTLSARELEIAQAIAGGAGRDEVAATLVLSRRTIDSHVQRIYTKLGISSRAELRAWLDL